MSFIFGFDMESTIPSTTPLQLLSSPWEFVLGPGDLLVVRE